MLNTMATHQQLSGISDDEMVNRMVNSYAERFHDDFWKYMNKKVISKLPSGPLCVDMGCGPGLFLQQLSSLCPSADLYGYDITEAMLAYARELEYEGKSPVYRPHNIAEKPLLFSDHTIHLFTMTALLHLLPDPVAVCREIKRVMAAGGYFVLYDWVRTPMEKYFERMGLESETDPDNKEKIRQRLYNLFPVHNKFTEEDWRYLLRTAGFEIEDCQQLGSPHFRIFLCRNSTRGDNK